MITFEAPTPSGPCTFMTRAVAVITRPGQVLLHRCVSDDFWSLPGGRCELLEPTGRGAEREIAEELRVTATTRRLLWVAETFYADRDGMQYHEMGFYHLVDIAPDSEVMQGDGPFPGYEDRLPLEFRWFALDSIDAVNLYPVFLRSALAGLPDSPAHPEHIVTHTRRGRE